MEMQVWWGGAIPVPVVVRVHTTAAPSLKLTPPTPLSRLEKGSPTTPCPAHGNWRRGGERASHPALCQERADKHPLPHVHLHGAEGVPLVPPAAHFEVDNLRHFI